MGGGVSTNHKSSNKIELSWLCQHLLSFSGFDLIPPINPNQRHTHQTMHPPMGGRFSTKFKSSNIIELSSLVQVLLNFDWFQGSPLWGWQVVDWVGWVLVCGGVHHAHTSTCMHACMHAHTHMYVKHDKHGCLHVGGHLQFSIQYTCACVHAHVCACM